MFYYSNNPEFDAECYLEARSMSEYEQEELENAEEKIDRLHNAIEDRIPDDEEDDWVLMENIIADYYKGYNTADETINELQLLLNKYERE